MLSLYRISLICLVSLLRVNPRLLCLTIFLTSVKLKATN